MKSKIWLIGASAISQDYFKVLKSLKQPVQVIGRGKSSAKSFFNATKHKVKTGGLKLYLKKSFPHTAIVTVGVEELFDTNCTPVLLFPSLNISNPSSKAVSPSSLRIVPSVLINEFGIKVIDIY